MDVTYCVCDALDGSSVRDTVDTASDDRRRLQIAVVVPGGGGMSPVLLFDDDTFSREVDGNVRPVFLFLKYAGQAMVRSGGGSFIAISSTASVFSTRYLASYAAGKAAVDQLVRVAADELGPLGVRVNSVQPGLTQTAATEGMFRNPKMRDAFLAEQPIPRHGQPDDITQAVRYFAGPESSWVTGQLLTVDGGNTLRSFIDYERASSVPDTRAVVLGTEGEPGMNRAPRAPPRSTSSSPPCSEIRDEYVLDEQRFTDPSTWSRAYRYVGRGAVGGIRALHGGRSRPAPPGLHRVARPQAPGRQPRRHLPLRPDPG